MRLDSINNVSEYEKMIEHAEISTSVETVKNRLNAIRFYHYVEHKINQSLKQKIT